MEMGPVALAREFHELSIDIKLAKLGVVVCKLFDLEVDTSIEFELKLFK
jgi:hypothetical protein